MHPLDNDRSHLYCRRCHSENRLIKHNSPDDQRYYLCSSCVEQEDKREMRFSTSWKRSRRPKRNNAEAVL